MEYPRTITPEQWQSRTLGTSQQSDDELRTVATDYLKALHECLSDWADRAGAAQWPDKYKHLDERLSYFSNKVRLALESADGVRELSSSVLDDFSCTPSSHAYVDLTKTHVSVVMTGTIEVFGMLRRELPMLIADVGAAVRAGAEARKMARIAQQQERDAETVRINPTDNAEAQS